MSFTVVVNEKGGTAHRLAFDANEISIGRIEENDICLPRANVSKKHTRIVAQGGQFLVADLKSTNGTYVNGKKLLAPQVIGPSDRIYVGDFVLNIEDEAASEVSTPALAAQRSSPFPLPAVGEPALDAVSDAEPALRRG